MRLERSLEGHSAVTCELKALDMSVSYGSEVSDRGLMAWFVPSSRFAVASMSENNLKSFEII